MYFNYIKKIMKVQIGQHIKHFILTTLKKIMKAQIGQHIKHFTYIGGFY